MRIGAVCINVRRLRRTNDLNAFLGDTKFGDIGGLDCSCWRQVLHIEASSELNKDASCRLAAWTILATDNEAIIRQQLELSLSKKRRLLAFCNG